MSDPKKKGSEPVSRMDAPRLSPAGPGKSEIERKQAEEALKRSEEYYRVLIEEATDIICTIDIKTGVISSANSFTEKALGYKREDILNKLGFLELIHLEDHEKVVRRMRELALKGKRDPNFPFRLRKADETYMDAEVNGAVTYDGKGDPETLICVIRDVTEHKQAEEALKESEERYLMLLDHSLTGISVIQDGRIQFVSKQVIEMLGYSRAELLGASFQQVVHPDDNELAQEALAKRLSGLDVTGHHQIRVVTKNGDIRWIETLGTPIHHKGKPAVLVNLIDITERKQAEEALRASETDYRAIFDSANDAIFVHDIDTGDILDVNREMCEMFGYSLEEARQVNVGALSAGKPPYTQEEALRWMRRAALGKPQLFEWMAKSKSGRLFWVEISLKRAAIGGKDCLLAIVRDITERKRAEEALRESDKRYLLLAENVTDVIWTMDLKSLQFTYVSPFVTSMRGYSVEEAMAQTLEEVLTPASLEVARKALAEELVAEQAEQQQIVRSRTLELEQTCKDGSTMWAEVTATFLRDPDGRPVELLGVTRDITDRKRAEEALRRSEEKFRLIFENANDAILWANTETGMITNCNKAAESLLEKKREEIIGCSQTIVHPPQKSEYYAKMFKRHLEQKGAFDEEAEVITKSGKIKPVHITASVTLVGGKPIIQGIFRDITERKRAEEQIQWSEEKYRTLFEESKDVVYMATPEGKLLDVNPAGIELFGGSSKEELLNVSFVRDIYVNPGDREKLTAIIAEQGFVKDHELITKRRDGQKLNVLVTATAVYDDEGNLVAYRGILRDITEQKRLEEQLFQAQKMESIGTLAGGIAHDFNNILGGILGYASFMKTKMPDDHALLNYVDTIERSAMRASELTTQLLAFARGGKYDARPVDLNRIVEETLEIVGRTFDKSIEVETHLCDQVPTVEADAGQIEQVIMNLCVNARDAMPDGGQLMVGTDVAMISEDYVKTHVDAKAGLHVMLSVSDTGIGMDNETSQRIFEPFFTTKEKGRGTGLGLSMVYGVIKNHGGFVRIYSEAGEGTTFIIYLPVSGKPEVKILAKTEMPKGGNELVLVVDDEEVIRDLAKDTLECYGYRVLTAENGAEAVEVYRQSKDEIALVVIDMVMPKMGGREAFLKLKKLNPRLKAILSTGYSQDGKAKEILERGVKGFIHKPYQLDELLSTVRSVLDAGDQGAS